MAHDATPSSGESEHTHLSTPPTKRAARTPRTGKPEHTPSQLEDRPTQSSVTHPPSADVRTALAEAARTQAYDNVFKRLVEHQADKLLPLFFQDLQIVGLEELTIELLIPPRRSDRVYKASRQHADGTVTVVILLVEFEVGDNQKMDKRLHVYQAILHEKYELPVHALLVYPFEVKGVTSPLVIADHSEVLDTFHYRRLPLAQQSAKAYMEQGVVPMYGLLPVMQDASDDLLLKAIDAMVQYYAENDSLLRDELLCFRLLFERAHRLPDVEMVRVERRLRMFDPLLENSPWVLEKVAEGRARGIAEGEARGEARGELRQAQETVIRFVQRRFPTLGDLAHAQMHQATQTRAVNALMEQLWFAPDEFAARALLETAHLS